MSRHRAVTGLVLVCAVALAAGLGGCSNKAQVFQDSNEGGWFSNSFDLLGKPDWARPSTTGAELGPRGPVAAEDLVNADGSCAPAAAPVAQAAEAPPAPATTASTPPAAGQAPAQQQGVGFEGGLGTPPAGGAAPPAVGGIALGMSECEAVRRAGQPTNVTISAGDKGERRVVVTYLTGPWPGIYTFDSGRLKVVDRAPEPPKPVKPVKKKKAPPKRAKSAAHQPVERTYVQ